MIRLFFSLKGQAIERVRLLAYPDKYAQMKIEPPQPSEPSEDGYEVLGWYQPEEALKLLKRFDDEGVYAQIEQSTGSDNASAVWGDMGRGFGIASQILISIHGSCREQALSIHRDLFGDGLAASLPEKIVEETETDEP
jgi:hypothetical protein